jgi:hypothetical protein
VDQLANIASSIFDIFSYTALQTNLVVPSDSPSISNHLEATQKKVDHSGAESINNAVDEL